MAEHTDEYPVPEEAVPETDTPSPVPAEESAEPAAETTESSAASDAEARLNAILTETAAPEPSATTEADAAPSEHTAETEAASDAETRLNTILAETAAPEPSAATEADAAPSENAAESSSEQTVSAAEITAEAAATATADAETKSGNDDDNEEKVTAKGILFDVLDLVESVITSVFVVMMIFTFLFGVANVEGSSMEPTLYNEDRLLVSRISRSFDQGDILIISNEASYTFDLSGNVVKGRGIEADGSKKNIVKRLIAKGGQKVDIDFEAGVVYVDGKALDEPYISAPTKRDNFAFEYPFTVPEGYVFVLGDNRPVSKDSRHPEVGLVREEDIVGKVFMRISPFSKIGFVK